MRIAYTHSLSPNLKIRLQKITAFSGTVALILFLILFIPCSSSAKVTGPCVNCHTMHNSQGGSEMATYGGTSGVNPCLTRGDCVGCHAYNTSGSDNVVNIGGSLVPQVWHAGTDLAAGNFKYVDGAGYTKGHNVIDLFGVNSDSTLDGPPGPINQSFHSGATVATDSNLTCAGTHGCHGKRAGGVGSIPSLKGAHHQNVDGQCNTDPATAVVYNSYRFLAGVKGLENTVSKWQNASSADHNEYFGVTTPLILGCGGGEISCHGGATGGTYSPNGSISAFCGTCHGNFHTLTGAGMGSTEGIGSSTSSPFQRHPTDIVLKGSGEYSAYTTYSIEAPIGRTTVPDAISSVVTPGTDVVTCLSCHAAHATNYPDMLRWDYNAMIAGGGGSDTGCFTCHTQKND